MLNVELIFFYMSLICHMYIMCCNVLCQTKKIEKLQNLKFSFKSCPITCISGNSCSCWHQLYVPS